VKDLKRKTCKEDAEFDDCTYLTLEECKSRNLKLMSSRMSSLKTKMRLIQMLHEAK